MTHSSSSKQAPIIVLFRQDLRLTDNPALWYASKLGAPIIPLYILDDQTPGQWKMGSAQRWWLHHSLKHLSHSLASEGGSLVLKRGETLQVLKELVKSCSPQAIYFNRCYEPFWVQLEKKIADPLTFPEVHIHSYNSALLVEPWMISNQQGGVYKVFTKFWNSVTKDLQFPQPLPKVTRLQSGQTSIESDDLASWGLLPNHPDWAGEFASVWQPGEEGAHKQLDQFIEKGLKNYKEGRNIPSIKGTSYLSPHLHFGEIGPRQVYQRVAEHENGNLEEVKSFLSELGWREFTHYSLYHFPKLPEESFQERFSRFPWKSDNASLKKWTKGLVGYPIVDAGMRQLWRTGWMHNRVRMIVASFLTKDLFIPWQKGEEWFWDTLVDASLAQNAFNWQWAAGCGMDAAPYFRIFNPILQGEKFDPDGTYIKKWVPELARLPSLYIHTPWEAPRELLKGLGIELGETYPLPLVDHKEARDEALKAFDSIK